MFSGAVTMIQPPNSAERNDAEQFQQYRSLLYLLARSHIGQRHRARIDPSDIVQQTLLDAHRNEDQFRGSTDAERLAWLKQILANNLADAVRGLARAKRDINRERPLEANVDDSFTRAEGWLAAIQSSPSQQAVRSEELMSLADALTNLPVPQREAIVLHHLQGLPLAEVGGQLDKSPAAVAGLLHRGLKRLKELMSPDANPSSSP